MLNKKFGLHLTKQQAQIQKSIKMVGIYAVRVKLHANIAPVISINIARSEQEARAQEKVAMAPEKQLKEEVAKIDAAEEAKPTKESSSDE